MKQVLLNDTAQKMYVEDLMTFEAIACKSSAKRELVVLQNKETFCEV